MEKIEDIKIKYDRERIRLEQIYQKTEGELTIALKNK